MIIVLMIIRLRRVVNGTKASVLSGTFYSYWYILFSVVLVLGSYYAGVPPELFAIYAVVAGLSAILSYRHSSKSLVFWKTENGDGYFKGGLIIMVTYVAAFAVRVGLTYFLVGIQYLFYFGGPGGVVHLSFPVLLGLITSDLLVMVGSGLRLGRNAQTLRLFRLIRKGHEEYLAVEHD